MLLLAIDTSGKQGSVALARGDGKSFNLITSTPVAGGTFSAQLVPQIAELLARNNLRKEDIDAFAAASGPGSFTGLRVGLAAIKALAEILQKPIFAVSLLQAIAANALRPQIGAWEIDAKAAVVALLDAGRGEIFVGKYKFGSPLPICAEEKLMRPEEVAAEIEKTGQKLAVLTPDPHLVETLKKLVRDPYLVWSQTVERPSSADIARVGMHKFLAGETVSVEALDANYIRRSDAEIFSLPRIAGGG
jgi:tRNA threonylcarbamoyladenosine biosynthesis protein TsaB